MSYWKPKRRVPAKFDRNNFPWKVREMKTGILEAKVKFCVCCGHRRVKFHHFHCPICWENKKKKENNNGFKRT